MPCWVYIGTIWRPPYEAGSLLIEVTAGCTHHKCKFYTLYDNFAFKFRMSPTLEDVEADILEAQIQISSFRSSHVRCIYSVGVNPFVLQFERLERILRLIHQYPKCETIGCFARVTDVALKTDDELQKLYWLGYDEITIGVETGDNEAIIFMNKEYLAHEIVGQTKRTNHASTTYNFFISLWYLTLVAELRMY